MCANLVAEHLVRLDVLTAPSYQVSPVAPRFKLGNASILMQPIG